MLKRFYNICKEKVSDADIGLHAILSANNLVEPFYEVVDPGCMAPVKAWMADKLLKPFKFCFTAIIGK